MYVKRSKLRFLNYRNYRGLVCIFAFFSAQICRPYPMLSRGFGINAPILNMNNLTPLYDDYHALAGSNNGAEWLANSWNIGFDGLNSVNSIISGIRNGSIGQVLFPASYLTSIGIDYTHSRSATKWQTTASNVGFASNGLDLDIADSTLFDNGVYVYDAGDANISSRIFSQNGARLNSSVNNSSQSVSLYWNTFL